MKKFIFCGLLCVSFLFLLFFPEQAIRGASTGLILWMETLVPTLLPLMIASNLLVQTNLAALIAAPLKRPLHRFLGISPSGAYGLAIGFLCGYPMGAKILADLSRKKMISQEEASYLVGFCNNVSPGFVLGYLLTGYLAKDSYKIPTMLIIYGAPLLFGLFSNHRYRQQAQEKIYGQNKASVTAPNFAMIDACIVNSVQNITKLGGYIILFSVFTAMISSLPDTFASWKASLCGLLEITTGIQQIGSLNLPFSVKYPLLMGLTTLGGLCSAAQSDSMLTEIGMPLDQYLRCKIYAGVIAVIMAFCFVM